MNTVLVSGLLAGGLAYHQPTFGCRVAAVMEPNYQTPAIRQQTDQFVKSLLIDEPNSLQNKSRPRPVPVQPYNAASPHDFESRYDNNFEDLYGVGERGNPDGWGFAVYPAAPTQQRPLLLKSITPAFADANYNTAVSKAVLPSNLYLGHVRLGSPECKEVQLTNVHPFSYRNWSFVHNGSVSGAFSPAVIGKINQYKPLLGDGPKGTTDSERAFYYFLSKLYETTGTTDSSKLPLQTVQSVFAQSVDELLAQSMSASTLKPLNGRVMGLKGEIKVPPSCNFILSDGNRLMAFRKVFNLYLGEKVLSNGQKTYIIASERTHLNDPGVTWLEIPEEHMLTISWDNAGNPTPVIEPLSRFLAPKKNMR